MFSRNEIIRYFDQFEDYGVYYQGPWKYYRHHCTRILTCAYEYFDNDIKVLDLGCGRMSSLPALVADDRIAEYYCVDSSPESLKALRASFENVTKVKIVESEICNFAASYSGKFDIIILFGVIMYLPRPDVLKLFVELNRILSSEGIIFIHEPNQKGKKGLDAYGMPLSRQFLNKITEKIEGCNVEELQSFNIIRLRRIISLFLRSLSKVLATLGYEPKKSAVFRLVSEFAWYVENKLEILLAQKMLGCDWAILLRKGTPGGN